MRPACEQCERLRASYRFAILTFVRSANRYGMSVLLNGAAARHDVSLRFRKADWLREQARRELLSHESSHACERGLALSA